MGSIPTTSTILDNSHIRVYLEWLFLTKKKRERVTVGQKRILDACCGSRMFWFDRENDDVVFADVRELDTTLCDGRTLKVSPDVISDFTDMIFDDETFNLVVFDPPHLECGETSWSALKYGTLKNMDWRTVLSKGFSECFRVLKPDGVLIFKWNETDIPLSEILKLTDEEPLFGHRSGKRMKTHWVAFIK